MDLLSTCFFFFFLHVAANAVNSRGEASVQAVGGMWVEVSEQSVQAKAGLALLINESSLHDTGRDQVHHDAHHLFPSERTLITTCSVEGHSNSARKWNHPVFWQRTSEWGRHFDYLPCSLHQRAVGLMREERSKEHCLTVSIFKGAATADAAALRAFMCVVSRRFASFAMRNQSACMHLHTNTHHPLPDSLPFILSLACCDRNESRGVWHLIWCKHSMFKGSVPDQN